MKQQFPRQSFNFCDKGAIAEGFQPGDFILVSSKGIFPKLIQFGQNLRNHEPRLTKWNHAAIIVTPQGDIVEATGTGVILSNIEKYVNNQYYVVRIDANDQDRHEAVDFALNCINDRYGWFTVVSIGLSFLTGLAWSFGFDGQMICSGLVARALERTTAIFKHDASRVTPYDLALYYIDGVV